MPARPRLAATLVLFLWAAPAVAQTGPQTAPDTGPATPPPGADGFSLMEEGAKLLFRGLMSEMEPALDGMGRALDGIEPTLRQVGPALRELVALMGDIENYEAPERLPNGDILIRRKPGAPPMPAVPVPGAGPLQDGEIEL